MQAYITLTRRELASFFVSMTGYVIIAAVVFLIGFSFASMLKGLNGEATPVPVPRYCGSTATRPILPVGSRRPVPTASRFAEAGGSKTRTCGMTGSSSSHSSRSAIVSNARLAPACSPRRLDTVRCYPMCAGF